MMDAEKYVVLFSVFCCLGAAIGELNLSEGSACTSQGVNGTCVSFYRCGSAAVSEAYRNAGYRDGEVAKFPETCSTKDRLPIICCTDCKISDHEKFKNYVVEPSGVITEKKGPKARDKCLDYFTRLPYWCRSQANIKFERKLDVEKNCHEYNINVAIPAESQEINNQKVTHTALLAYGENVESALWLCSGFVISERFILTAGHCTTSREHGPTTFARLGFKKRSDPIESWQVYKIKRIITHPDYIVPSKYNDIALLETENEITFNENVLPICLDVGGADKRNAYFSGWGVTKFGGPVSDALKLVRLQEVAEPDCAAAYTPHRHLRQGYNHSTMMCYSAAKNAIGSCQGDAGGPLQVAEHNCLFTAVGVTSFGKGCGSTPDIYTRVEHYVPWIESIVWP